jgi:uncharacterized lipoprotein YajG
MIIVRPTQLVSLALLAGALLVAGCDRGPRMVPVTGVVTVDGKPVDKAAVLFAHVDGGRPTVGVTDEQGRFRLTTDGREGALLGEHGVAITRYEVTGYVINEEGFPVRDPSQPETLRWLVPEFYSRLNTSGLKVTVSEDQTEFRFDLKSEPPAT